MIFIFSFDTEENYEKDEINFFDYLSTEQTALIDSNKLFIYVDIWASWCGPCIANLKFLNRIPDSTFTKNVAILALNIDDNEENWKSNSKLFISNNKIINIDRKSVV